MRNKPDHAAFVPAALVSYPDTFMYDEPASGSTKTIGSVRHGRAYCAKIRDAVAIGGIGFSEAEISINSLPNGEYDLHLNAMFKELCTDLPIV